MEAPKIFISYSWTTPAHEAWVLELASRLTDSGVVVALDKWDLREGQDKYAFMESMVTDAAVKKVLVICDRAYASKADARRGGVGTESQIISKEVYESASQTKFVPIVAETDEHGKPHLPAYMGGRIYIDMSDSADRYRNFEQLVRWIFDKPTHERPPLGKPPSYITEPNKPHLGTASQHRLAADAIREDRRTAVPALQDYLDAFSNALERLRMDTTGSAPLDDLVVASIEDFKPHRDDFVDLLSLVARYRVDDEIYETLHRFFEQLLRYKSKPDEARAWSEQWADNYRFFSYELFLYTAATLLRHQRFVPLRHLLVSPYYVNLNSRQMVSYQEFRDPIRSLEQRNTRLQLNRLSIVADIIKERATRAELPFEQVMQADFVLFLRSVLNHGHGRNWWFPNSLLYAESYGKPFEIFARSVSQSFFERALSPLLDVATKQQLQEQFAANTKGFQFAALWQYRGFDPAALMRLEQLATIP